MTPWRIAKQRQRDTSVHQKTSSVGDRWRVCFLIVSFFENKKPLTEWRSLRMDHRMPYSFFSFLAISATCLPCVLAMTSSFSLGMRAPSGFAMVLAPYGEPPLISPVAMSDFSE